MEKLNPDYLLKDEIEFEIRVRGEIPVKGVAELRKQLRSLVKSKKELVDKFQDEAYAEEDLEICKLKADELLAQVSDLGLSPDLRSTAVFRLRLRVEHLLRRFRFWARSGLLGGGVDVAPFEALVVEGLNRLKDSVGLEREEDGVVLPPFASGLQGELGADVSARQEIPVAPAGAVVMTPVSVSPVVSPATTVPQSGVAASTSLPSVATLSPAGTLPTNSQSMLTRLDDGYAKLPNPLSSIIQSIPVVDGLDTKTLLDFIEILLRAREFPGMSDTMLLKIVFPNCRSPLLEVLLSCLGGGTSFDVFHSKVLENFLPGRLRENLRQERFCRLQGQGEELAHFVSSVKLAAKVLKIGMSEKEIVDVILEGIAPEIRSLLVFCNRPTTFAELSQMCVSAGAIQYNDRLRKSINNQRQPVQVMPIMGNPQAPSGGNFGPRLCYGCGQPGHIRRFCRSGVVSRPGPSSDTIHNTSSPASKNGSGGKEGQ